MNNLCLGLSGVDPMREIMSYVVKTSYSKSPTVRVWVLAVGGDPKWYEVIVNITGHFWIISSVEL